MLAILAAAAALALPFLPQHDEPSARFACPHRMPDEPPAPHPFDAKRLSGLRLPEAVALARRHGCFVRVVMSNGARLNTTLDLKGYRINVRTRNGVVTSIKDVG